MSTRYMLLWRDFIYKADLRPQRKLNGSVFGDRTPGALSKNPSELRRLLNFSCRDLSVLIVGNDSLLMMALEEVEHFLLKHSMDSPMFIKKLKMYLGTDTEHFVLELMTFAGSPYDSPISYDLHMKYYVPSTATSDVKGLSGAVSFGTFSRLVVPDEAFPEVELEYESPSENVQVLRRMQTGLISRLRRNLQKSVATSDDPRAIVERKYIENFLEDMENQGSQPQPRKELRLVQSNVVRRHRRAPTTMPIFRPVHPYHAAQKRH